MFTYISPGLLRCMIARATSTRSMFTLLRAPGNRTVCKNYSVSYFSIIQLNKVIKVIERSK